MVLRAIRWLLAIAVALAQACGGPAPAPASAPPTASTSVTAPGPSSRSVSVSAAAAESSDPGDIAIAQLNRWYNRTDRDCGSPELPAFLCSGVMLRGVQTSPNFYPWDPSSSSSTKGGTSVSWIRMDDNFSAKAYPNGLIFYPPGEAPEGTRPMEVLCTFPMDADSWNRATLQGCGPHSRWPLQSVPCQNLNIHTAEQWTAHFNGDITQQCGWNVRLDSPDPAAHFYESVRVRDTLAVAYWNRYNELLVKSWDAGIGGSLSLQSMFYMSGNTTGLANARYDQKRYYDLYGKFLPVIALTLPAAKGSTASFAFSWADQNPGMAPVGSLRPQVVQASGDSGRQLRIDDFYRRDDVTVRLPQYFGMAVGQEVGIHWAGPVAYTETRRVTAVGAMDFSVPRVEVIDAIGRTVPVTFFVTRDAKTEEHSASLDLSIEGQALDLPAPTIDATAGKVSFGFNGIRPGFHTLSMRWAGVVVRDTTRYTATHDGEQTFDVPVAWVEENRGRTVFVNIAVGDAAGSRYMFSRILRFQVPGEEVANLRPQVVEATGNSGRLLRIDDFYRLDNVTVRVPEYPGMASGQELGIRWEGRVAYTDAKSVTKVGATDFSVPRVEVIDAIGRTVPVTFYVRRNGIPEEDSASLDLAVEAQALDLPAPTIDTTHGKVSFTFDGIVPGTHALSMRWAGVVVRDTAQQVVTHGGEQTFDVPPAWVDENRGRTVFVSIAVGDIRGSRFMFSRVLRLQL